jgi:hypothetical protein
MIDTVLEKPMFKHDCTRPNCCVYRGSTNVADVYTHGDNQITLRYSDEPADYGSMPAYTRPEYIRKMCGID